ncbi:putative membrane protein [Halpernia humi]|uniref:Putative membrane protein n=1 Tax=Halpernia humi TaxID=493375 RepID=A0A1H5ZTU1_9FLAO|nr:DUF4142 domain-containing protein [Halpernia humi]SEG39908.1 putative membrane protein [Halpernia humi]
MKNSILTLLAIASLTACKKKETTTVDNTMDSTKMASPKDSTMMTTDSTAMKEATTMLSEQDKTFADAAAKGGMMEVILGNIAATNGSNQKVKDFGIMMVDDHTKANNELKTWAMTANYKLPTNLDADQQKTVDNLKMKMGADFDKAYINLMVPDHKAVIEAFKKESMAGTGDLKAFATKTIPTLETHLKKAEDAMKMIK